MVPDAWKEAMSRGAEPLDRVEPEKTTSINAILRLPLTVPRLMLCALEDLHSVAENARGQPDAVDQIKALLESLLAEVSAVTLVAGDVAAQAREIVSGGAKLNRTGRVLDGHAVQTVEGSRDLVEVARSLDETLKVFRQHLPRVLRSLDTVDELEEAAETMADTMEPLQGAAERVGRITKRLTR